MIHRDRRWLTPAELRRVVESQRVGSVGRGSEFARSVSP
jgi:hypothetical protein